MRTLKERGGGLFQNIKGFFTRKKSKVTPVSQRQNTRRVPEKTTLYQKLKGKVKGLNKPPKSAPTQYPLTKYPMFKGNERRDAVVDEANLAFVQSQQMKYPVTKDIDKTTMSPPTSDSDPRNVVSMTLPIEPVRDGQRRLFLFFYNKMRQQQSLSISPNPLYASEEEVKELCYAYRNFKFTKYPELIKGKMSKEERNSYTVDFFNEAAEELFGQVPIAPHDAEYALKLEIQTAENVNHVYPSLENPDVLQFAQAYGGELARYDALMTYGPRMADYLADLDEGFCRAPPSDMNRPILKTLNSPYCICIFRDRAHFDRYIGSGLKGCTHYLLLNPRNIPSPDTFSISQNTIPITASRFLETSFIQDAFKEQGVNTMDEDLFKLLQKEAPQLIESSKVIIATADKFKYLKLYDHFMILTEKALPEGLIVSYKDPLQLAALRRAFDEDREFLLADPYTAYCTKKKNMNLWSKAFGIKASPTKGVYWNSNFDSYVLLRDVEKFYIDFCQYQLVIGKYLDLTQNSKASSVEENLQKASQLYKVSLKDKKFLQTLYSVANGEKIFSEFKKLQKNLITHDTPIQTMEDVRVLIGKLNPIWRPSRNLFEPPPVALPLPRPGPDPRPALTVRNVVLPLPSSPPSSLPSLPESPPNSRRDSLASENSYVPIPEAMAAPAASKEQQIQEARRYIQEINSELSRASPVYNLTRRKYRSQTNNALQSRYEKLSKRPHGSLAKQDRNFMTNYTTILRNFASHRNILLQTRQQQVDLLRRLEATSV